MMALGFDDTAVEAAGVAAATGDAAATGEAAGTAEAAETGEAAAAAEGAAAGDAAGLAQRSAPSWAAQPQSSRAMSAQPPCSGCTPPAGPWRPANRSRQPPCGARLPAARSARRASRAPRGRARNLPSQDSSIGHPGSKKCAGMLTRRCRRRARGRGLAYLLVLRTERASETPLTCGADCGAGALASVARGGASAAAAAGAVSVGAL